MAKNKTLNKRSKYKVLIVDDHPVVCQGLAQLINQESDFIVCGIAGDIPQALKTINSCKPDIIIVDLSLGHTSGIKLIEDLSLNYSDLIILAFSMHDESIYAERCLRAGAKGYIMKQEPPEKVVSALRTIIHGNIYISNKLNKLFLHKLVAGKSDAPRSPVEVLSNRELEVFQLLGQGLKTRKIAEELNLSVKTSETYIDKIKKKMDINDSRHLLLHAVQWPMSALTTCLCR